MTHRHRIKRGVTPRPSDHHLRLLSRMIARAERASGDLNRNAGSFIEASARAEKAILPVGHQGRGNVFSALMHLAQGLDARMRAADGDRAERLAMQAEIGKAAGLCRAALNGPAPRARMDVDG